MSLGNKTEVWKKSTYQNICSKVHVVPLYLLEIGMFLFQEKDKNRKKKKTVSHKYK